MVTDEEIKEVANKALNFIVSLKFNELTEASLDEFKEYKARVIDELIRIA